MRRCCSVQSRRRSSPTQGGPSYWQSTGSRHRVDPSRAIGAVSSLSGDTAGGVEIELSDISIKPLPPPPVPWMSRRSSSKFQPLEEEGVMPLSSVAGLPQQSEFGTSTHELHSQL